MNLLKFFPLPSYLRIPAVGLDISDRSIKYVELEKLEDEIRLKRFGERKMEEGVIKSGVIKNSGKLVENLRMLRREIDLDYVTSSLPEERAFLKVVQMPLMKEEQVKKSLELQLEEIVPLSIRDINFDCEVIGQTSAGKKLEVILTAFPQKLIKEYTESLARSGFWPVAFELENQAIARSLIGAEEKDTVMIVDFGRTRTSFLVAEEGVTKFTSTIPVAGESLNKALAKNFKIGIFEAERLKQEQILSKKTDEKILSTILPTLSAIREEIHRVLVYWRTHAGEQNFKNEDIKKIIFCGGEANMFGLTDYMTYELKKPVELGNPWVNITSFKNYVPEMKKRDSLAFATALGLSLRSFM